jgi:putative ATPase
MKPLAERLRPKDLTNYVGQEHIVGDQGTLGQILKSKYLPSIILWGPPGVGKTTLAKIIAEKTQRKFYELSAIQSGVKEVREVIKNASENNLFSSSSPILFIDEIHRFSKSQQDSLLGAVEQGSIILIGATTENPSFEVISALLSRCQVYTLKAHDTNSLNKILENAIVTDEFLKEKKISLIETDYIIQISSGDVRKALNALEIVCESLPEPIKITNVVAKSVLQKNISRYDKSGEMHYDIISAFIKSIRGSDPNASIYWLARMIEGGEDVKFIARRLIIVASEDIGNANPNALILAQSTFEAVRNIGYPEARIILSQCTVYLANSPKSNSSYLAIDQALDFVRKTGNIPIPLHLRNAPTKLMKDLNYGQDYKYPHNYAHNFVEQNYLPQEIKGSIFYTPGHNPKESTWLTKLKSFWKNIYPYG